jgi:hypothetical protein
MSKFGKAFFERLLERIEAATPEEVQAKCAKAEFSANQYSEMLEALNSEYAYATVKTAVVGQSQASDVFALTLSASEECVWLMAA